LSSTSLPPAPAGVSRGTPIFATRTSHDCFRSCPWRPHTSEETRSSCCMRMHPTTGRLHDNNG
ncbi:unnamed protein product, partial [Ectocarpus sp. 6 AP-2014]